jgi:nucleotide-binding universal stress UspA family protein
MNFEEIQPFMRLGSILQWLVIALVFLAGFLQIAKFLLDKKVENMREDIIRTKVAEYDKTVKELQTKAAERIEKRQVALEREKERLIPETLIPELKADLLQYGGSTVRLACDKNDKEALALAEQLKAVFEEAGWKVKGIVQAVHAKPVKDVVLILNHEDQKTKANVLFSALTTLSIKSSARLNKKQEEDLGIIVGQRE